MHRTAAVLSALLLTAAPAIADDFVTLDAEGSVTETADRLVAAVEQAGATVFARVPHSKGAESVGMELQDAELVIFGNPKLGTPALQEDIRAGLVLPLRVLVHDDGGQTRITYEEVDDMFDDLDIDDDAEFVDQMKGALETLTTAAAGS
ncbi:DUF302 domain-containing protein [Silicimonas algicola]|uniref:Uncharacterized protein (DUF302 family) n=1 Tax=Silicimonas algicola TaxID=1826607 RepID=A0A316G2L6_9RHOB|nr:DUF302 domain-containing protein [Silicimonas algicola]AZQ66902.1 DUF302 domain-containing protein [Silicimonas algicola]PWK55184.1 uncharacterized protein (DUF302 family) [Silicimonas algicola]